MRRFPPGGSVRVLAALLAIAPVARAEGWLLLTTDPPGLAAWADRRYLGPTPLLAGLDPGQRRVLVAAADSLFHPPAADTLLRIAEAETLTVHLAVGREIVVRSIPFGLPLYNGERRLGTTPLRTRVPADALDRLRLRTREGTVPVDADSLRASGTWTMRRVARGESDPSARARPAWRRIGRWALPVLAAALASGGGVVERAADRSYERYERSIEPDRIRSHYEAARARDRWASALWVAAEAALAASLVAWVWPEGREHSAPAAGGAP